MPPHAASAQPLITAAPDLVDAVNRWQRHLATERRLAKNSLVAYARPTPPPRGPPPPVSDLRLFRPGAGAEPRAQRGVPPPPPPVLRVLRGGRRTEGIESRTLAGGFAGIRSLIIGKETV